MCFRYLPLPLLVFSVSRLMVFERRPWQLKIIVYLHLDLRIINILQLIDLTIKVIKQVIVILTSSSALQIQLCPRRRLLHLSPFMPLNRLHIIHTQVLQLQSLLLINDNDDDYDDVHCDECQVPIYENTTGPIGSSTSNYIDLNQSRFVHLEIPFLLH